MLLRLIFVILAAVGVARACSCAEETVKQAKRQAEIVFRGTITAFKDSGGGARVAVFRVSRVWKGKVTERFEMPAFETQAACIGFWPSFLKVGNELLVYAYRLGTPAAYFTDICTRTALAAKSKDFAELGRGWEPTRSEPSAGSSRTKTIK